MRLEITNRARTYGYLTWPKKLDAEVAKTLSADREAVQVYLNETFLGQKRIDWKYRRISLGYKYTRALPATARYFNISMGKDGCLVIKSIE